MSDNEILRKDACVRRWVLLISVVIFLGVGAAIVISPLLGLSRMADAVDILKAWSGSAGLIMGFVLGYFFSNKS